MFFESRSNTRFHVFSDPEICNSSSARMDLSHVSSGLAMIFPLRTISGFTFFLGRYQISHFKRCFPVVSEIHRYTSCQWQLESYSRFRKSRCPAFFVCFYDVLSACRYVRTLRRVYYRMSTLHQ